jgi:hypothetical protein
MVSTHKQRRNVACYNTAFHDNRLLLDAAQRDAQQRALIGKLRGLVHPHHRGVRESEVVDHDGRISISQEITVRFLFAPPLDPLPR